MVMAIAVLLTGCEQSENSSYLNEETLCDDLYNNYLQTMQNSESFTDPQAKKQYIYETMESYSWDYQEQTRIVNEMTLQEQAEWIKNTQPKHIQRWLTKLGDSFRPFAGDISVEQIANDDSLNLEEKKMLTAILAGGNYLKKICQNGIQTRATATDCLNQYNKDCERALQTYAVAGSVGAISGGLLGLGAATALCAMQLKWVKDDYADCLKSVN